MKNKCLFVFCGLFFFLLSEAGYIHVFCLFHKITGFYCPGCGVTRMLDAIFHFSFYQAFRYNPLVFVLLVLFVLGKILHLNLAKKYRDILLYFLVFVVIFYGVLRNMELFSWLGPTVV